MNSLQYFKQARAHLFAQLNGFKNCLLCNTNNTIQHLSFVCTQLNC